MIKQEIYHLMTLIKLAEKEPNVNQSMDAVIPGLIGGGTISLLAVIVGVVAMYNPTWHAYLTSTGFLVMWLFTLSGLTLGQLYITWQLVSAFSEAPSQTDKATVK